MDIHILVVEDDEHIRNTVKTFLESAGYVVDTSFDGAAALEQFYDKNYHLVILDIMLPHMNGLELLKEIRRMSNVPALMMTALDDDVHQLAAFANEADDYITKPFLMKILLSRVEAILRRCGLIKKEICVGSLTLCPDSYKAAYDGIDIQLTPKEFDILLFLTQNKGKVIPHETLLIKVWGYDFAGNERVADSHLKNLRKKLPINIIKTIKGIGYRLEVEE